jgi:hypothetical protein
MTMSDRNQFFHELAGMAGSMFKVILNGSTPRAR